MRRLRGIFAGISCFVTLCLTTTAPAETNDTVHSFLPPAAQERFEIQQKVAPLPGNCWECLEKRYAKVLDLESERQQVVVDGYAVVEQCQGRKEFRTQPWERRWVYKVTVRHAGGEQANDAAVHSRAEVTAAFLSRTTPFHEPECRIATFNGDRLLLLDDNTGGNCRNCESSIVLSLQPGHLLEPCGNATVGNTPQPNQVELFVMEDCAETTAWLCHAASPSPPIYCKLENGRLVPDRDKCLRNWSKAIAENNTEIARLLQSRGPGNLAEQLYSRLLDNYLMRYLSGEEEAAMAELKEGLEPLMDEQGRIVMGPDAKVLWHDVEKEVHKATGGTR